MAAGNSLMSWDALAASFPVTGFARHDLRNTTPVLDFHQTNEEAAYFSGIMPRHFSGIGITVRLAWSATSGVGPGYVTAWLFSLERHDTGFDTDSTDGFAWHGFVYSTAALINGALAYAEVGFDNLTSQIQAGEHFRLRIIRSATDPSDNLPDDAELWGVELRETGAAERPGIDLQPVT